MEFRRSSSFDENQSREGRPREHQDRTRFLRPDRSRSAPPDLEKNRHQEIDTNSEIEASNNAVEILKNQGKQLIQDFHHFLLGIKTNIINKSAINENQFNMYKNLIQRYTLYNASRFNFDINEFNNDLTNYQLKELKSNDYKLDLIRVVTYKIIEPINDFSTMEPFNKCNQEFLDKTKNRAELVKDLKCFSSEIQFQLIQKLPLNKMQINTYEGLIDRRNKTFEDFNTPNTSYDYYFDEKQQSHTNEQVQLIRSMSDNIDNIVQSIRIAHPTFEDLVSQQNIITKRFLAFQESYNQSREHELPPNEHKDIIKLIDVYKAVFSKAKHIKETLKPFQKTRLQADEARVKKYKAEVERLVTSQNNPG